MLDSILKTSYSSILSLIIRKKKNDRRGWNFVRRRVICFPRKMVCLGNGSQMGGKANVGCTLWALPNVAFWARQSMQGELQKIYIEHRWKADATHFMPFARAPRPPPPPPQLWRSGKGGIDWSSRQGLPWGLVHNGYARQRSYGRRRKVGQIKLSLKYWEVGWDGNWEKGKEIL